MNAADGFAFNGKNITNMYIDYIERLPKKYLIMLEFVKRDTPVLLIMCSPFVLKSLENLFLV